MRIVTGLFLLFTLGQIRLSHFPNENGKAQAHFPTENGVVAPARLVG